MTGPARFQTDAAIARDFPASNTGRVRLERLFLSLGPTLEKMGDGEFEPLRAAVTEAAQLNVVPAIMTLADHLRKTAPVEAFAWYCDAAAQQCAPAMTQAGLMASNGAGVPADLPQAAVWFQMASNLGDAPGKACLAECYLYGTGVPRNERHAVELLQAAANAGDPRAMDLLGTCYHRGLGTAKNYEECLRLFSRAHELGFQDAAGNLGVLYANGDGVSRDPAESGGAVQRGSAERQRLLHVPARRVPGIRHRHPGERGGGGRVVSQGGGAGKSHGAGLVHPASHGGAEGEIEARAILLHRHFIFRRVETSSPSAMRRLFFLLPLLLFLAGCAETPPYVYQYVPGRTATLQNGFAMAPPQAPDRVQMAVAAANRIAGLPYSYGSGHREEFGARLRLFRRHFLCPEGGRAAGFHDRLQRVPPLRRAGAGPLDQRLRAARACLPGHGGAALRYGLARGERAAVDHPQPPRGSLRHPPSPGAVSGAPGPEK